MTTDYQAYALNIADVGDGYTAEDVATYQAIIDEELERIPDARCSVRVETYETRSGLETVEFNHDERVELALSLAYARFIGEASEIARFEAEIDDWNRENAAAEWTPSVDEEI